VPQGYDAERRHPLLLALHGAGGDGRHAHREWEDVADELGMLVVSPTDPGSNEGYRFTHAERSATLAALRYARRRYNVDENRIFITGISRGGHLTWDVMLRFPDLFAAAAPMIGGPRWNIQNGQNNLRYMENVAALPIRDLQGWQDDAGMLFNLELAFEKLEAFKAPDAELLRFPALGHSFELGAVDWKSFWGGRARRPVPETVVRAAARLDEARAAWLEITAFDKTVAEEFVLKVDARKYGSLDDAGKRRFHALAADKKTARLKGTLTAPGEIVLESSGVARARILLTTEMFEPGKPVDVRWNGRALKKTAEPDKEVLLLDFVERFDRTFLPVVEVSVP
jgi:predicted esterase